MVPTDSVREEEFEGAVIWRERALIETNECDGNGCRSLKNSSQCFADGVHRRYTHHRTAS